MEFSAIQCFVKVVQTGSFTRAAEALHTQKAHVSRVVSQLEAALGVRLLERSTRALSLTEVGREFFERSVGILASVDDARRAVQKSQGEPRGTLKLTCGVEFGMMAVNGWISRYLAQYPQVLVNADFTGRLVDIVHEGFDLAIRVGPLADSSLAARKLGELHYGLFASDAYLQRHPAPRSPADLGQHSLLAFSGGAFQTGWTLWRDGACERVLLGASRTWSVDSENQPQRGQLLPDLQPTTSKSDRLLGPRLKANNLFAVRDAAVQGLGIVQLPWLVAAPEVARHSLQPVLPGWAPEPVPVHAVFASARYLTPKVRAFIDLALASWAEQQKTHQIS